MSKQASKKKYEEKNQEQRRAKKAADYKLNREAILASRKAYQQANKLEISAKKKLYYAKRREDLIAAARAWNETNPEAKLRNNKRWDAKHPENRRTHVRNRAARLRSAEGSYTADQIVKLAENQQYRCANFRCRVDISTGFEKDHIKPLSRGGSNWIGNIQLLCPPCNRRKSAKEPERWQAEPHGTKKALP